MNGVLDHMQRGPARREMRAWKHGALAVHRNCGSNWLIIGFGAIGEGVAKRAARSVPTSPAFGVPRYLMSWRMQSSRMMRLRACSWR